MQAAVIHWGAPRDIAGDTDVSTNGVLVKAIAKSGNEYPTVNGVTFCPAYGNDTVSGTNASNYATGSLPVGGGISQSYATLLSKNDYNTGTGSTVTLTINGLKTGYHYEIQVWMNDSSASGQGTLTIKSPGGADPWVQLDANKTGATGGLGQHAIGTFTADGASQTVTFKGSVNGMIQAYQVRRVPAPLAAVAWGAWKEITGNTDVNTNGSAVKAYVFGSAAPAAAINGVTFTRFAAQSVDTLSGFTTPSSDVFGSANAPYSGFTSDYKKILGSAAYGGRNASMTLNSLTPGQWYEVQVWVNDSRALAGGRTVRINGSAFLNHNPGGPSDNLAYEGNTGHHMTGTFRASAASQRFDFVASASAQINGLQLRAIPVVDSLAFDAMQRRQFTINSFIDGKMSSTQRFEKVHLLFGTGQIATAKTEARSASLWWGAGNEYTFDGYPAIDMVIRWKKYIDTTSRNAIKGRLPSINYVTPGTSNLQKLAWTMRFLGSEEFGEEAFQHPRNDYRASDPNCRKTLLQRLKDEANYGCREFASNDYSILNILPSLSIAQLAKDPELRAHATASFPAMLAQMAAVWQPKDNYIGVWSGRSYEDQNGKLGVFGSLLWQTFGSYVRSGEAKAMALLAASDYRVPTPILHAANQRSTVYTSRLYGGNASQTGFVSGDDYILFSACDNDNENNNWSHPYGVRWSGMTSYFWLGACSSDYAEDIRDAKNHGTNSYNMGTVQHRDSVLYAFDFTGPYPAATNVPYAQSQVPGSYTAMINDSATGRIYLHYGKVMIAVTSSIPFSWNPNSGIWSARHTPSPGDSEFRVAVGGVGYPLVAGNPAYKSTIDNANNRFAMAIETANPSEYPGATAAEQLAAFKADIVASTSISHLNAYPATGYYSNRHGDTLQKQSYDASGTRRPGYVNGVSVDYNNWPILENPWMKQAENSGLATITAGGRQTVLNFNSGGMTHSAVTATGGPLPQVGSDPATSVTTNSAVCNGLLVSSGSSAATVTLYWGTTDGGDNPAAWANNLSLGTPAAGALATTISGLAGGTTYYYRHFASNTEGDVWSNCSTSFQTLIPQTVTAPPGVPALPTTILTVGSVPLTWAAVADATSYNIKRATTSGGPYTTIKTAQATASYTDTTAVNGTVYYYVVSAVNAGGESVNSGEVKGTPAVVPAAPTGVATSMGYMYARISWTATPWAATYTVKRSSTNGGPYTVIASGLTSPVYEDPTAVNLSTYYYVVSATNVAGEGANSSQVSITVNVASYINQLSGNWSTNTWYPNPPGTPVSGTTAIIDFGNSAAISSNNDMGSFTLNKLRFMEQGVTLTGNPLLFSGSNPTVSSLNNVASSIANAITLGATTTFDVAANVLTVNGVISGTGGLIKSGNGTLVLGGINTYTGNTTLSGGTLSLTANAPGLKSLIFGAAQASPNTATLIASADATATSLTAWTNSTASNFLYIGAGKTLTVNGAVNIHTTGSTGTRLVFNRTGAVPTSGFTVNNSAADFLFAQATDTASTRINTLDLRNVGTFTANVANFRNGWSTTVNYARPGTNTLYLATNNTITTASGGTLSVGDTNMSGGGGGASTLYLGSGNNTIQSNTIAVGRSMTIDGSTPTGRILFNGTTGNLTLRGSAGGSTAVTNFYVGMHTDTGSAHPDSKRIGLVDLTDGTTTGAITNLYLGYNTQNTNAAGDAEGIFLLGGSASSLSVANLFLGYSTVASSADYFANGELDLSDGALNVTGNITMAYDGAAGSAAGMGGTLLLSGGTLTVGGNIVAGGASGVSSLTLNGGTLDMTGGAIGSATNPVDSLVFQSGTLKNVASINGSAGLTQREAGTLVLSGNNTYAGMTTVEDDTIQVTGTLSGPVTVNAAATLSGSGTIGGAVIANGELAPGINGVGRLQINNALTLGSASTTTIFTNRTASPNSTGVGGLTSITYGGTLTVSDLGGGLAVGDTFVLFSSGAYSGSFAALDLPALGAGLVWDTRKLSVNGSIAVSVAPVVTAVAGTAQVTLNWTAVPGATSYNIKRSLVSGGPYTLIASGVTATSYTDINLDPSTTYYYTVSAVIAAVEGVDSNEVSAATGTGSIARYWDTSSTAGLQGGAGTWNTATAAWSNGTGGNSTLLNWRDNVPALFQSGTNTVTVSGTIAVGSIAQSVNGTSTTISGGTLQLNGTGGISNGVSSGNQPLTIGSALVLNSATFPVNTQQPINLNGAMSGTSDLIKTGPSTLTLGGANTVAGDVVLDAGTLSYGNNASKVEALTFGAALGSTNTSTLNLAGNVTATSLSVRNNSVANNAISIASGKVLAINGGLTMNTASGGTANLVVSGAGAMNISNPAAMILIGATSDANTRTFNLDMSGLTGGFTTQVANFYVGRATASANSVPNATVKLAPGSNISAVNFSIGDDNGNGGNGGGQSTTVTLAGGTNFFKTTTLTVGRIKSGTQTLNFAPGGGTLALSGTTGGALGTMYVGYKPHTGSSTNVTGVADFTNGTVSGSIGNLYVGHMTNSQGSNSPKAVGTFTLGTSSSNNLTVTNLNIGTFVGTTVPTSAKYSDGTVNLKGGQWAVTTVDMTSEQYSFARLNITGGTMTVSNVITGGPGGNETLTLNGGTLDMTSGAIGDATNTVSTLNFQSGTLKNVTTINGTAGLTKTTAGTLTLDGTMGYTGVTTISAGTLRVGAASSTSTTTSLATSSSIVNNATLTFRRTDAAEVDVAGSISGTGSVLYEGSGTINQSRYTGESASTYSGGTAISNARVNLTTATGFGTGAVTINSGATAFINGAGTVANPFTLAGNGWIETAGQLGALRLATGSVLTGAITLAGNTRIAVNTAGTATISSPISGAFDLEVGEDSATGTLILTGAHTYTGNTTISAGTLVVDGVLASGGGAVTVGGSGVLTGTGTIHRPVIINGRLVNGIGGAGSLVFSNTLTLAAGSSTTISLNRTATPNCSQLSSSGAMTFSGTLNVTNAGETLQLGDRFVLFPTGGHSGSFSTINLPLLDSGFVWDTSKLYVDGSIEVKRGLVIDANLKLHLDASNPSSLVLDSNNRVSRWNDANGGANYAAQDSGAQQPTLVVAPTLGRKIMDFGPFVAGSTGQWLQFKDGTGANLNLSSIRSVFVVMKGGNHMLGDDNNFHFHRAPDYASPTCPLWRSSSASANIRNGQTYLNGGAVPIDGTTTPMPSGYWLASVITSGPVEASRLACDRTARTGGQQIAELLIYDRVLTDTERQSTEAYLMAKWFSANTPPVITVPPAMTVEATGSNGAVVNFATTAVDHIGGSIATLNSPPSGSTFPIGSTPVTVTATDAERYSAITTMTVTVQDSIAPSITVPQNITVEASGPAGAIVTFTTSATDTVSGNCTTQNTPASGSTFPVGTTTVSVTSSDAANNSATSSFTVTVAPIVSSYATWQSANGAGSQTFDQDHDNDGVKNGIEYFMGATGTTLTANPTVVNGAITWPMGATYTGTYGTHYVVQTSPDLITWTPATVGVGPGFVAISPATSVTYTLPTPAGKRFVRLLVHPN